MPGLDAGHAGFRILLFTLFRSRNLGRNLAYLRGLVVVFSLHVYARVLADAALKRYYLEMRYKNERYSRKA